MKMKSADRAPAAKPIEIKRNPERPPLSWALEGAKCARRNVVINHREVWPRAFAAA